MSTALSTTGAGGEGTTHFFDCHTHRSDTPPGRGLVNLPDTVLDEAVPSLPGTEGALFSVGLHPWHLTEENAERRLSGLSARLKRGGVAAVGECGFDRLCATPMALQERCMEAQVVLAARHGLPVIIHCVRAWDELLRLRRRHPGGLWIVHGFRGGAEQARQLLRAGLALGIGPLSRDASIALCPADCLFPETDTAEAALLPPLYARIAQLKGIDAEALSRHCRQTFAPGGAECR